MTKILVTSKFFNEDTGVLLEPKTVYESDGVLRVIPSFLEYKEAEDCYSVKHYNEYVYVPVSECVVYDGVTPLKTLDDTLNGLLDTTADVHEAYEDAFGITIGMMYRVDFDGVVIKHKTNEQQEEEEETPDDISRKPFIY